MTVKELLSFRRKNGLLEKVTIWKNCNENANEYEKIAIEYDGPKNSRIQS